MNITNAQQTEKEHHISLIIPMEKHGGNTLRTIDAIVRRSGFSSVAENVRVLLEEMEGNAGGSIEQRLHANVSTLQDCFIETLYTVLHLDGVDVNHKVTLRLDENDRLVLFEEHPDGVRIHRLLETCPELSTVFAEIAAQSTVLRDLRSLRQLVASGRSRDVSGKYRLSLKGEMSHFYFYG